MDFVDKLKITLESRVYDPGHDLDHALTVMKHAYIISKEINLTSVQTNLVLLAAGCHDINDHKFDNPTIDLKEFVSDYCDTPEERNLVVKMIDLVSYSKNYDDPYEHDWMLVPRYADRIESTGKIGVRRALIYAKYINRPLFHFHMIYDHVHKLLKNDPHRPENCYGYQIYGKLSTFDYLFNKVMHFEPAAYLGQYLWHKMEEGKNEVLLFLLSVVEEHLKRVANGETPLESNSSFLEHLLSDQINCARAL